MQLGLRGLWRRDCGCRASRHPHGVSRPGLSRWRDGTRNPSLRYPAPRWERWAGRSHTLRPVRPAGCWATGPPWDTGAGPQLRKARDPWTLPSRSMVLTPLESQPMATAEALEPRGLGRAVPRLPPGAQERSPMTGTEAEKVNDGGGGCRRLGGHTRAPMRGCPKGPRTMGRVLGPLQRAAAQPRRPAC